MRWVSSIAPSLALSGWMATSTITEITLMTKNSTATSDPVIVGSSLALDCCSKWSKYGTAYVNAYSLFIEWLEQARGGVLVDGPNKPARKLEVTILNDQSEKAKVTENFREMLHGRSYKLLLSTYSSGLSALSAQEVNATNAVMIAPGAASTGVVRGRPNVYSMLAPSFDYMKGPFNAVAEFARSASWIAEPTRLMTDVCGQVPVLASDANMQLKHGIPVSEDADETEVESVVSKLVLDPPDVIVACVYVNVCHRLIKEMKKQNLRPKAVLFTICVTDSSFQELGDDALDMIGTTPWLPSFTQMSSVTGWTARIFSSMYKHKFKVVPPYQAAAAFASLLSLVEAIEAARSTNPTLVSAQLRMLQRQTLYGEVAFDDNGQYLGGMKGVQLKKVGGKLVLVAPRAIAEENMSYPMASWRERWCNSRQNIKDFAWREGICAQCNAGSVSEWSHDLQHRICEPCPCGTSAVASNMGSLCVACPLGRVSGTACDGLQCESCPAGRFQNTIGKMTCDACDAGKAAADIGMSECNSCSPGRSQSAEGEAACIRCPVGRFQDGLGNGTSCQDCLPGKTTGAMGAESAHECRCDDHTYMSDQGNCKPCPVGVVCKDGAVPLTKPNYMMIPGSSRSSIPLDIFMCGSTVRCPGQPQSIDDPVCGELMEGLNCGLCKRGYFIEGDKCKMCDDNYAWPLFMSMSVAFLCCGLFLWKWNGRGADDRTAQSVLASITFGMILGLVQALGVFSLLQVSWPERLRTILLILHSYSFDVAVLVGMPCMFHGDIKAPYVFNLTMPISIVCACFVWYLIFRCMNLVSGGKVHCFDSNQLWNSIGMIIQTTYVSLVIATVAMVECFESASGTRVLRRYPFARCGSDDHNELTPVIVLGFLVYIAGIIGVFSYLCWVAPRHYQDIGFRNLVDFLVFKYHPSYWWFGLILTFRSLLIALVSAVAPTSGYNQFFLLSLILIASLIAILLCMPYRSSDANYVEIAVLLFLIAILVVGSWFIEDSDRGSTEKSQMLGFAMLVIASACFGMLSLVLLYGIFVAMYPLSLQQRTEDNAMQILPRTRVMCHGLELLTDKQLKELLTSATSCDRKYLSKLISWIVLETSGAMPEKLIEQRLSIKNQNLVLNPDGTTSSRTPSSSLREALFAMRRSAYSSSIGTQQYLDLLESAASSQSFTEVTSFQECTDILPGSVASSTTDKSLSIENIF